MVFDLDAKRLYKFLTVRASIAHVSARFSLLILMFQHVNENV
jgi:hypothetical protein